MATSKVKAKGPASPLHFSTQRSRFRLRVSHGGYIITRYLKLIGLHILDLDQENLHLLKFLFEPMQMQVVLAL